MPGRPAQPLCAPRTMDTEHVREGLRAVQPAMVLAAKVYGVSVLGQLLFAALITLADGDAWIEGGHVGALPVYTTSTHTTVSSGVTVATARACI